MANARGRKHTICIGWGIEIVKVCQVHFPRNGSILVTFPYQPDSPGVAARVEILPEKMTYHLPDEFSRVTSHKIKYSHPIDGRAHFSGDGKIRALVWAEGAAALHGTVGHFFTLHIHGLRHFTTVNGGELRNPAIHLMEFQTSIEPSLRLVGRFGTTDKFDVNQPGKSVVRGRLPNGVEADLLVLAPEAGSPLDGHAVFVQCIEEDAINSSRPFFVSLQAGFGPGIDDPQAESSMLVLNYPATDLDSFQSMDWSP